MVIGGCDRRSSEPTLFELLPPSKTGVTFANTLPERPDFNILNYLYYYNGGGVAAGDIDGDGLVDLYFTSNLGSNKLYRNKGNYQFEDITDSAHVADAAGWKTGVTMADVNGDGRIDIYVSAVDYLNEHGRNALYINNGDGTFTERAKEYGLDFAGYSTQALFFDYDGDGDLDMFLLNHSTHTERQMGSATQAEERNPRAGDRLYRNDNGHFIDVSEASGVGEKGVDGYGLGVVASDFNLDGCPDLYVTNDFQGNDYLYINNCNGTFTESIAKATKHTSRFSMGVDAGDFNNDGWPDIISLDMLPARQDILNTTSTAEMFNVFDLRLKAGYHPQFARNNLQLNRGGARFSDIGYFAGVAATDWSWAALFADFDNDGRKDLFITNGVFRRPNDMDYINYVGNEAVQASLADGIGQEDLGLLKRMPSVPLPNYAFRNNGDLTFADVSRSWGIDQPGFSNGALYVDLNNTGALDLVVNNINGPASIYRNKAREGGGNGFLTVVLRGAHANTEGIGAKVMVSTGANTQLLEQMPTRGFESSVDPRLHFGVGAAAKIDSVRVIWPDSRYQKIVNVSTNRVLTLWQDSAAGKFDYTSINSARNSNPLLVDVTARRGIDFRHVEDPFFEFNRQPLMPHLLSTEGPALAVADVNGDGLDDIFIGGAKWQPGRLYIQNPAGTFAPSAQPDIAADSLAEDIDAVFFDANGDGKQDLLVVSGGDEFWGEEDALRPRLYMNDGAGHFRRDSVALPAIYENGSCAVVDDFNGDGHPDVFLGSRVVTRSYGTTPKSHLLLNDGRGRFRDVTGEIAPGLSNAGMITSGAWVDYDNDGKLDLIIAGEWTPIRFFHQENGRFVERTKEVGFSGTSGWWNSVTAVDLRKTGKPDLILGNLGLNSYIRATKDQTARLYVGDFFATGSPKQILTVFRDGVSYPIFGRDEFVRAMPLLASKYPTYKDFGASKIEDILPAAELKKATVLEATTLVSMIARNNGNGTFTLSPLPEEAQLSPVYAAVATDVDGDGVDDVLLGGNFYGVTPLEGRYDASYGTLLRGLPGGRLVPVPLTAMGAAIDGEVRHMKLVRGPRGAQFIAVARNNDKLELLRVRGAPSAPRTGHP